MRDARQVLRHANQCWASSHLFRADSPVQIARGLLGRIRAGARGRIQSLGVFENEFQRGRGEHAQQDHVGHGKQDQKRDRPARHRHRE